MSELVREFAKFWPDWRFEVIELIFEDIEEERLFEVDRELIRTDPDTSNCVFKLPVIVVIFAVGPNC